jgi:2-polyprenyl-6-hydroxyphenyl methylase/3-demethylubiquinone-9 3-methyltransferase
MSIDNVDATELAKFASRAEEWWDPRGPFKTLHDINPLRVEYIERHVSLAGAHVLDVGCGGGILGEALVARGARVQGIDRAAANITAAMRHAAESRVDITYRNIDVEQVAAEEPGAYDVVTCLEMLEHVPDPDRVVAACSAAVKSGGLVFFSTLNRNPKSFVLAIVGAEYLLGWLPRGTHEYAKLIRPAELAAACRRHRLELLELTGLHLNPLTRSYSLGGNVDVNYFAVAKKLGSA